MTIEEREKFWQAVETGDNPLLSAMSSLVERWGLPAIIMALGDISVVLSEDAIDASNITPSQRGLIMNACAQVSNLSDLMHAEMEFIKANK
jgi:hypothetical protein|tara:strand:+ start:144 stop:416 length:273 start_codon:yes stop_codon:yes gene_type:complete